ncbi:MAG: helix-turn-helix domain-containing protein [candidate division FCPU426 bacterium]
MKIKKHTMLESGKERKEIAETLASMTGAPGSKPFRGRLIYGSKSIKELRQKLGLTQKAFARLVLVEPAAVQSWEQGRRVPDSSRMAILFMLHEHPKELCAWLTKAGEKVLA